MPGRTHNNRLQRPLLRDAAEPTRSVPDGETYATSEIVQAGDCVSREDAGGN